MGIFLFAGGGGNILIINKILINIWVVEDGVVHGL